MKSIRQCFFSFALVIGLCSVGTTYGAETDAVAIEFFETRVRPILVNHCYTCHSANTNAKGGLRVDDVNGLRQGGGKGPAVVPGHPEESLMIQAVSHTHESLKMPPDGKLSEEQIFDLTTWIREGAAWPRVEAPVHFGQDAAEYERLRTMHWAWQPIAERHTPELSDSPHSNDAIDWFILAKLREHSLTQVAPADKRTLIRRVTFDLTGLPPSLDEIEDFVHDSSFDAYERVVDRLLASLAFGEKWGRHWLDIARFAESTGSARNLPYPHAWRYRDYVIDAFNADKPYDQFVREQIAGDLLPSSSDALRQEQLIATGFLALGIKDVNQRFKVRYIMDNVDEQIDTVTRSFLALTVSCARCHDHKFDPIPTTDYYALAGIFESTDLCAGLRNKMGGGGYDYYDTEMLLALDASSEADAEHVAKIEQAKADLKQAQSALRELVDDPKKAEAGVGREQSLKQARQRVKKIQDELISLSDPALHGSVALGVRDAKSVGDAQLRIRGEAEKLGPKVPRGYLSILALANTSAPNAQQSGRLELANWLASPDNPLTPRVMVNRVWKHLFGAGLVASVDNFGTTGDVPSHPELLDYLALRFVRDGWSVKKLIRQIVLTNSYQLAADELAEANAVDPSNRLIWRHDVRRLEAEEIRDAMLSAAGNLQRTRPVKSIAKELPVVEVRNNGPEAKRIRAEAQQSANRSVYLPQLRGISPVSLEVFDYADHGMVTGDRPVTTVPQQSLYMLNNSFVCDQSRALASRLLDQVVSNDSERIQLAYRLVMGREASPQELQLVQHYLADYELAARDASSTKATQAVAEKSGTVAANTSTANQAASDPDYSEGEEDSSAVENSAATDPKVAAWEAFCQALFASAEFRFLE